ncbi:hypothetical protein QUF65_04310 [Lysinibacillus sphaericus]|uniref:hypothetical protein n=1 Tax=Lysinibacillus sphaericus TaxID=1421 RepID=UPI0025A0F727|nr:hypothetical protein [Lysinibacillus sphaericus]MDM5350105.1 hypothetical protein [Lysinibacillus sphaericus]
MNVLIVHFHKLSGMTAPIKKEKIKLEFIKDCSLRQLIFCRRGWAIALLAYLKQN